MAPTINRGIPEGGTTVDQDSIRDPRQQQTAISTRDEHLPASRGDGGRGYQQFNTAAGVIPNGGSNGQGILTTDLTENRVVGDDDGVKTSNKQPAPLFERLVTEEVQELKTYVRIIESQHRRLAELELVHGDLEARLQTESRGRQHLEAALEAREREWKSMFEELKTDRDHWKDVVKAEQNKNARLIDQVVRKDQDIHRMLQRKVRSFVKCLFLVALMEIGSDIFLPLQYDHDGGRSVRNVRQQTADRGERTVASASKSPESRSELHKSPHEILAASGSVEKVRKRNTQSLLRDFFGM